MMVATLLIYVNLFLALIIAVVEFTSARRCGIRIKYFYSAIGSLWVAINLVTIIFDLGSSQWFLVTVVRPSNTLTLALVAVGGIRRFLTCGGSK